jgi:hypothetical protein
MILFLNMFTINILDFIMDILIYILIDMEIVKIKIVQIMILELVHGKNFNKQYINIFILIKNFE